MLLTLWEFVLELGGIATAGSVDRMVTTLAKLPVDRIEEFADELAEALWQLDTPGLAEQFTGMLPVMFEEFEHALIARMATDGSVATRCAVVAAGPQAYARVLEDLHLGPASRQVVSAELAKAAARAGSPHRWELGSAALLAGAPERAWALASGSPKSKARKWSHLTPHSIMEGSNRQGGVHGWRPLPAHPPERPTAPESARDRTWLEFIASEEITAAEGRALLAGVSHEQHDYDRHAEDLTAAQARVARDPRIVEWAKSAGVDELELSIVYTDLAAHESLYDVAKPLQVRRRKGVVKATLIRPRSRRPTDSDLASGTAHEQEIRTAITEVGDWLREHPPRKRPRSGAKTAAPPDVLWAHIPRLGGVATPETVDALVQVLATHPEAEIEAFAEGLFEALHAIDTPDGFRQPVRDTDDPPGPTLPMSADVFLDARCAVVAAGRERYDRIRADPAALAGTWNMSQASSLLTAAPRAWEAATGADWAYLPTNEIETGSNRAAWRQSIERASPSGP